MASSTTLPIVGTFTCGDPRPVGLWKYTEDKPTVTLNAKAFNTINTGGTITTVHLARARITLNAIHILATVTLDKRVIGKAQMTLVGKTPIMRLPTKAVISVKPKITLNGKALVTRDSEVKVIGFKPQLVLSGKPLTLRKSAIIVIGKARMTLNARVFLARQPTKATFTATPRLTLNAKVYSRVTSYTLPMGKPKLILNPGRIERAGQPGLIVSIPVARTLTPTVPQTGTLVPSPSYARTLVPTTEKNE